MHSHIHGFFDSTTGTVSYVVFDRIGGTGAIIDSVLDYDHQAGRTHTTGADKIIAFVKANALTVAWILETHAHADHLSAAPYVRQAVGGKITIGAAISHVQEVFKGIFHLEPSFDTHGGQFDHLLSEGDTLAIGELTLTALSVPGHTPACMAYKVGDAVFVGDTLFMPDVGTSRCDFPGGDAHTLYASIQHILALPDDTRLFMCHDYPPASRSATWQTTVAAQRAHNIHVHDGISQADFVAMRTARDATLAMPVLLLPAVQVNIRAGNLPPPEDNGTHYLKIPINVL